MEKDYSGDIKKVSDAQCELVDEIKQVRGQIDHIEKMTLGLRDDVAAILRHLGLEDYFRMHQGKRADADIRRIIERVLSHDPTLDGEYVFDTYVCKLLEANFEVITMEEHKEEAAEWRKEQWKVWGKEIETIRREVMKRQKFESVSM